MDPKSLVARLQEAKGYFDRSSACLTEEDSGFAPSEGMMTAAQQVAHVAQTIEWFFEGAFRPEGFDLDFEAHARECAAVTSLQAAREWLDRSVADSEKVILGHTSEEWTAPLPEGPVMGGAPRHTILGALQDHTAHHRGALTVYARLCGRTPAMPYM